MAFISGPTKGIINVLPESWIARPEIFWPGYPIELFVSIEWPTTLAGTEPANIARNQLAERRAVWIVISAATISIPALRQKVLS